MDDAAHDPEQAMRRLLAGFFVSQALFVIARLGIADLLRNGPAGAGALARAVGAHEESVRRLLRALAGMGIVCEREDGRFEGTALSGLLASDGGLRNVAVMLGEEQFRAWAHLLDSVRTGRPAFEIAFGRGLFDYYAANPAAEAVFDEAMSEFTRRETGDLMTAYDFSSFGTIVDVGGGYGDLLAALLRANPSARGVLFDLPGTIERARSRFPSDLLARCDLVEGDFFAEVPPGGDAYVLKSVAHDWDDEHCARILGACRRAAPEGARLLLVERVMPERVAPEPGILLKVLGDLQMLAVTGGRERTEREMRALLERTGFRTLRVLPAASHLDIIEALPV